MPPLKAQVKNGHLVIEEPTDLPEGQVIYLVPADEAYNDPHDDVELRRELEAGIAELKEGQFVDEDVVLADMRARRT